MVEEEILVLNLRRSLKKFSFMHLVNIDVCAVAGALLCFEAVTVEE